MADRTLTINHADGGSETYTINRDKFAGVRDMTVDGQTVSVDHTAVPKEQAKETTFGGSQSITVKRDIDPLLSKVVGGAAAAYSLRDLNDILGNSNKVVRVRRSSDNAEKDFTASEMGAALEDWVNADGTQYINFDGGDDDITASAIVPSTDDFTLTITAFIPSIPTSTRGLFGSAAAGAGRHLIQLNTDGTVQFFCENLGGAAITSNSITASAVNTIELVRSGQTFSISLNSGADASRTGSSIVLTTGNNNIGDPYGGDNFKGVITSIQLDSSEIWDGTESDAVANGWTVNGTPSSTALNDGYVETWYDQSGNGNDATQTVAANQPKIVDAGTYLGEIDFDGNDFLPLSGDGLNLFRNVGYSHLFSVVTPDVTGTGTSRYFIGRTGGTSARFLLGDSTASAARSRLGARRLDADSFDNFTSNVSHNNTETLMTGFVNWADASAYLYFNGTEVGSDTNFLTAGNTEDTASTTIAIGGETDVLSSDFKAKEFIIYNTDQSANRTAIEANINNEYSIY